MHCFVALKIVTEYGLVDAQCFSTCSSGHGQSPFIVTKGLIHIATSCLALFNLQLCTSLPFNFVDF